MSTNKILLPIVTSIVPRVPNVGVKASCIATNTVNQMLEEFKLHFVLKFLTWYVTSKRFGLAPFNDSIQLDERQHSYSPSSVPE